MRKQRLNDISYLDGIALGLTIATLLMLVAFLILDFPVEESAWIGMLGSMIVALFSIAAAFLALHGNRVQIEQNSNIESDRRRRSLNAATAVLPSILSEICGIAQNNLKRIFETHNPDCKIELQSIPSELIPHIKECIEFADNISQERLANILRHFQIMHVRSSRADYLPLRPKLTDEHESLNRDHAVSDAIGWAVVYALTEDAFRFARKQSPIPRRLSKERVPNAFLTADIWIEMYADLSSNLNNRIRDDCLEFNWDF